MQAIEAHFAACEACAEETRRVFETLVDLDSWTPESMGEAVRREALVLGLAQAEEDEQEGTDWAKRLRRWRQGVAQAADGGLELIVAASGIRIVTQSLRKFVAPGGIRFEPLLASRGQAPDAAGTPEKPPGAAVLSVEKPDVRVGVDENNKVTVTLQSWPADRLPPGIVVIDKLGKQRPLRLELLRSESGEYRTEFFREPGEFMILFAPVERKEPD
ncbi:MAG: hypothetical protein ACLQG3_04915 [Terracidiphilus sp.]